MSPEPLASLWVAAATQQAAQFGILGRIRANITKDGSFAGTLERALFDDGSYLPALVFRPDCHRVHGVSGLH